MAMLRCEEQTRAKANARAPVVDLLDGTPKAHPDKVDS